MPDAETLLDQLLERGGAELDAAMSASDAPSLEALGVRAYNEGRLVLAERCYARALELEPTERRRLRLAATHLRMGRLREVVSELTPWLDRDETGYAHLHAGNAQRYLASMADAERLLTAARTAAERRRDAPLAIAAGCAEGELLLDQGEPKLAVAAFGKALGLTELTPDDAITVAPLAGMAEAHAAWRAPQKAVTLAQRALDRAQVSGRRGSVARARLALARATGHEPDVLAAIDAARDAPHVPLWIRAHALAALSTVAQRADHLPPGSVADVATHVGMHRESAALRREDTP